MTALLEGPQPARTRRPDAARRPGRIARWQIRRGRLVVSGELDQSSCSSVRTGFVEAMDDPDVTVIDLTGVTFFGAAAIEILEEFGLHDRYTVLGSAQVRRVLDIVGSTHLLTDVPPSE